MNPESFRRVRELYHELNERSEAEQRRALAELDLEDEVRAELEALLAREPAIHAFDEENLGRVGQALVDDATDPALPERIGPYRVVRKLGEGGMGAVYVGEHVDSGATAAIKVVRPGLGGPELAKRFTREARVLARLKHPGIASFLESGEARLRVGVESVTLPFLAMEYVQGEPLMRHASRHGLNDLARVELMARICEAVHHAHELGVVHRDLKPGNILVEWSGDDEVGLPKVLDFGVARVADVDVQTMTATNSGAILGTVPYMSPEQVAGRRSALDRRSDVYSLGVLLFELLAGRLPYDVRGRPILDAARIIQEEEPTRLGSVVARLRGDLEVIVAKALEKEPARRYPTANELAKDLRCFARGEAIAARPATWSHQIAKFAHRHSVLVTTLCGTFVALVIGLVTALWFALGEHEARLAALRLAYRTAVDGAASDLSRGDVETASQRLAQVSPALRGWEWHYLHGRLDTGLVRCTELPPEAGFSTSFAFSEDGTAVLAVFYDRKALRAHLCTWGLHGEPLRVRTLENVRFATLGPRGRRLYWQPVETGTLEVERLEDGERVASYPLGPDADERVLPSATLDRTVAFSSERAAWIDLTGATHRRDHEIPGLANPPMLSTDGSRLAWIAHGALVTMRSSGEEATKEVFGDGRRPLKVALSPDGDRVAVSQRSTIEVHGLEPGAPAEPETVFDGHEDEIRTMAFSPDGRLVASAAEDSVVRVWDSRTGLEQASFPCAWTLSMSLAFSDDATLLAAMERGTGNEGFAIHVWSTTGAGESIAVGEMIRGLTFSASGERLYAATAGGHLVVLDVATGFEVARDDAAGTAAFVFAALAGPDDRWIAVGDREPPQGRGVVRVLDTATGEVRTLASQERTPRIGLAVAPDDGRLAACLGSSDVMEWEPGPWTEVGHQETGLDAAVAIAFGPSGDRLAVGGDDGRIELFDARNLTQRPVELTAHTASVWSLAFHPDGTRLASASVDGTALAWDLTEPGRFVECARSERTFFTVAYSPDGARLVVGGVDRLVHLVDGTDSEPIARLPGHRDAVRAAAFSPDGRCLATGSGDGTVRLWSLDSASRRHRARAEYEEMLGRIQPRVDAWIAELGPSAAAERARTDVELSEREREIALQVVLRRALE